jgi:hypothetical protein
LALLNRTDEALAEYDTAIKLSPQNRMFEFSKEQLLAGNLKKIVSQQ